MAKLYLNYGAMSAGKTIEVITTAYKYNSRGMKALVIKPKIDTKANGFVSSRIGMKKKVDILLKNDDSLFNYVKKKDAITCLIIDEAQFLTLNQVLELVIITKEWNIPVICYGLKVDFQGNLFEGSKALLSYADALQELVAICNCGKKARFNARKINGKYLFDGEQILIGEDESYEPLCESCFMKKVLLPYSKQFQEIYKKSENIYDSI